MPPKKQIQEEIPVEAEAEDVEPAEPVILRKSFRLPGQLYHGDCKLGYGQRKGTYIRHGYGQQVTTALAPLGGQRFETVVLNVYDGCWIEDEPSGHGSCKWSDGSSYEGELLQGRLHGHGRFGWSDGSSYDGSFFEGLMHGQGRFESRFDGGRFMQGRFHRNCFQKSDGRWVDVLKHLKHNELKQILEGNPLAAAAAALSRRNTGGHGGATENLVYRCEPDQLREKLGSILRGNLVPLVLSEESLGSALNHFIASGAIHDPSAQCVSIRLASVAKRRHHDYHHLFHDAIRKSILAGSYFALVFEDDSAGCSLGPDECDQDAWLRRPVATTPAPCLPEDWRLVGLFDESSLPPEIFNPRIFNGRGKARHFLPDSSSTNDSNPPLVPAEGSSSQAQPVEDNAEKFEKVAAVSQLAAVPMPGLGVGIAAGNTGPRLGPTGHEFEASDDVAGFPLAHQLRPVIVAQGHVPGGLADVEVQQIVNSRFANHIPLHCVAVLLLEKTFEG